MTTTNNLYVRLDEVQKYLSQICDYDSSLMKGLNSLPSINPEEMIYEMQRQNKASFDYLNDRLAGPVREKLLQELLQKFKS